VGCLEDLVSSQQVAAVETSFQSVSPSQWRRF